MALKLRSGDRIVFFRNDRTMRIEYSEKNARIHKKLFYSPPSRPTDDKFYLGFKLSPVPCYVIATALAQLFGLSAYRESQTAYGVIAYTLI